MPTGAGPDADIVMQASARRAQFAVNIPGTRTIRQKCLIVLKRHRFRLSKAIAHGLAQTLASQMSCIGVQWPAEFPCINLAGQGTDIARWPLSAATARSYCLACKSRCRSCGELFVESRRKRFSSLRDREGRKICKFARTTRDFGWRGAGAVRGPERPGKPGSPPARAEISRATIQSSPSVAARMPAQLWLR